MRTTFVGHKITIFVGCNFYELAHDHKIKAHKFLECKLGEADIVKVDYLVSFS